MMAEDVNTALETFIENWSLLKMCCGNEFGGAFEAYLNKYNKIPEVVKEPSLVDYPKQDYRLAFSILSQTLLDKVEVTREQYYMMLV